MNKLIRKEAKGKQLPSNIEDLSKYVLIVREKMAAVRAEIRVIDKVDYG